jgi:hypothetical protein
MLQVLHHFRAVHGLVDQEAGTGRVDLRLRRQGSEWSK